jgi:hypothetical protein
MAPDRATTFLNVIMHPAERSVKTSYAHGGVDHRFQGQRIE